LYAANARQFSIQLVGGNSSGKTAFLAALQHLYLGKANEVDKFMVTGEPQNNFDNLENMYEIGLTEPSSSTTVLTYSFVHTLKEVAKHNLVIFDIADELILSGTYERNPRNLGFSDGIIFIIDPLSIPSVRSEYVKSEDVDEADKYSADNNTNELIIEFVHQFSRITGQASRKQNKIPVAVVINKVDIKIVKREIGMPKIKATYNANPSRYGNDISVARDEICREYLSRIGLDNTLNNLDGTFSNVRYFPVSALGHTAQSGNKFEPIGILAPFVWITKESASQLSDIFSKVYGEDSK
jgi:GTPase SAR1 family protein